MLFSEFNEFAEFGWKFAAIAIKSFFTVFWWNRFAVLFALFVLRWLFLLLY